MGGDRILQLESEHNEADVPKCNKVKIKYTFLAPVRQIVLAHNSMTLLNVCEESFEKPKMPTRTLKMLK